MPILRPRRARLAWIVSFAILLAALLPSFAQAVIARQAGQLMEICSATGATFVVLQGSPGQAPGIDRSTDSGMLTDSSTDGSTGTDDTHGKRTDSSSSMNCPYCAIHHGAPSLPPSELSWQPPATLHFELPQLYLQSPRPLFAWAPALARGPPFLA